MKSNNAIRKFLVLSLCLLTWGSVKAQDSTKVSQPTEVKSLNKLQLNIIGLGYEREQRVAKTMTVYVGAGVNGAFFYETSYQMDQNYNITAHTDSHFKIYPTLNAGFRHYYNLERRVKKGKTTTNNTAGYVALDLLGIFPPKSGMSNQLNITPQWGFQTAAGRKVNFELALGPAIVVTNIETRIDLSGRIGFNFLL